MADQFLTKKITWSLYILYNIDIQVILFVYIFSFFEKQNTEWTSEPQPEPPIPQTISVPPATPTQIQVPRTQKPPEPRQQSFRQQPPPMKVNVPRPITPIKNGTVLKDLLYKLRKTVFRYWMYDTSRKWFWLKYFIFTSHKNFMYCQFFVGLPLMSSTNSPKCSDMSAVQGKESFPQP